jgi:hypothetical protein
MTLHKIKKQKLLKEPFNEESLKLARAIYNTYIELDKELDLELKLKNIKKLLKLDDSRESIKHIISLLEDINEPLVVYDFKFCAKIYPVKIVTFFSYNIENDILNIAINEDFLLVEEEYMLDSFLSK